jgi:hypothetical protein
MLLTEFFNTPLSEGDSYAKFTSASPTAESKCTPEQNNMVRTKDNSNKKIHEAVSLKEDISMPDVITARQLATKSLRDPNARQEYFNFLTHLRNKHGKDYSTQVHQEATKLSAVKKDINGIDTITAKE